MGGLVVSQSLTHPKVGLANLTSGLLTLSCIPLKQIPLMFLTAFCVIISLHYFSFDAIPQKSGEVRKEMLSYDKRPLEAEHPYLAQEPYRAIFKPED